MSTIVFIILQIITMIILAPLVNGIVNKIKALVQKRKGQSVFQMYYDLSKLFKKDTVVSETSSWIFKATPYILFGSTLAASLFVPVTTLVEGVSFPGDAVMFIYVLALGRFFLMLGGLDTASTFGGMGSSREGMISSLIEPAMLVAIFTVAFFSGSLSIPGMMNFSAYEASSAVSPAYIMAFIAMVIVLIAETARIPIDDPETHLELTMVHEAMILEYSGRHLALMEYSSVIKQLIIITFIVNIFIPHDMFLQMGGPLALVLSIAIYIFKVVVISIVMALVEVNTVKFRLFSVPNMAVMAFIIALLGFANCFILVNN